MEIVQIPFVLNSKEVGKGMQEVVLHIVALHLLLESISPLCVLAINTHIQQAHIETVPEFERFQNTHGPFDFFLVGKVVDKNLGFLQLGALKITIRHNAVAHTHSRKLIDRQNLIQ